MAGTTAQKVIALVAKTKNINPESITLESTFEELKMDSLDGLDLFFELEEAFDLTIPDEQARSLRSVRSVVEKIDSLRANQEPSGTGLPAQN